MESELNVVGKTCCIEIIYVACDESEIRRRSFSQNREFSSFCRRIRMTHNRIPANLRFFRKFQLKHVLI